MESVVNNSNKGNLVNLNFWEMSIDSVDVKILSLNCWGFGLGLSKNRSERMEDIGMFIALKDYDVVMLQEVWKKKDYLTIKGLVSSVLPNGHYFENGIIGTGTCVFTKSRISDCTFHEFGLNGSPCGRINGFA